MLERYMLEGYSSSGCSHRAPRAYSRALVEHRAAAAALLYAPLLYYRAAAAARTPPPYM
jgi:hypothetical protein